MATPGRWYFPATGDAVIDATTNGYVWVLGSDRTIDWGLASGDVSWANPPALAETLNTVFNTFSYYANIRFNYVGSFASVPAAAEGGSEITISNTGSLFTSPNQWARAFFPMPVATIYQGEAGDIWINTASPAMTLPSYGLGSAGRFLFMHELGHALGLKHPHDNGGTGRPTLPQIALGGMDNDIFTMMSYEDDFNWNFREFDPAAPMILDVLALQYLYGPNMQTNAGDTSFALQRTSYYDTYWDASGFDLVTALASPEGWMILLPDQPMTTLVPTKTGLATPLVETTMDAPHTLVWLAGDLENATGSAFDDLITGGGTANQLRGSGGNDVIAGMGGDDFIDGGAGIDIAVYSGTVPQYTLERTTTGVIVRGVEGTDTLTGVERLQVGSSKVAIDIDGNGGMAYRIYQAAFDRTPDIGGVSYWLGRMDGGMSLYDVAANFIASPEFQSTYGPLNNNQFAAQLYRNVLHRESDAGGLAFWTQALDSGNMTKPHVLASFSESPENQANLMGVLEYGFFYV